MACSREAVYAMLLNPPEEATREPLEELIKWWRAKREERLAAEKMAAQIKKDEDAFKSFILEAFKKQKFEGMIIDGRTTGLTTKSVATVCDKEALVQHIISTKQLDLLQFRLSTGAVDERKEAGVSVPGTEYIDVYDLFDRKV